MVERRCETCEYFLPTRHEDAGRCHRSPPHLSPKLGVMHEHPWVDKGGWCGEWKPKEQK